MAEINPAPSCGVLNPKGRLLSTIHPALFYSARVYPRSRTAGYSRRCWIKQVRLSGLGGQGVVLAGLLLGQAGVVEGRYISGSDSYGAQARGSGCKSEIVFSDGLIDFPHIITADILIAMSQGSYNLYCGEVREDSGFIFYDRGLVTPKEELKVNPAPRVKTRGFLGGRYFDAPLHPCSEERGFTGCGVKQLGIPATEVSVKRLKNKQVANIVLLGALVETTKIVSPMALEKAIAMHISKRLHSLNLKALRMGMELGRKMNG